MRARVRAFQDSGTEEKVREKIQVFNEDLNERGRRELNRQMPIDVFNLLGFFLFLGGGGGSRHKHVAVTQIEEWVFCSCR